MRHITIGIIGVLLFSGCQTEKQPPDLSRSSSYTVKIPQSSSAQVIDPQTAAMLKRHSIQYGAQPSVTEDIQVSAPGEKTPPDKITTW